MTTRVYIANNQSLRQPSGVGESYQKFVELVPLDKSGNQTGPVITLATGMAQDVFIHLNQTYLVREVTEPILETK